MTVQRKVHRAPTVDQIQTASEWVTRLRGKLTRALWSEFEAWLEADPRNQAVYLKQERSWIRLRFWVRTRSRLQKAKVNSDVIHESGSMRAIRHTSALRNARSARIGRVSVTTASPMPRVAMQLQPKISIGASNADAAAVEITPVASPAQTSFVDATYAVWLPKVRGVLVQSPPAGPRRFSLDLRKAIANLALERSILIVRKCEEIQRAQRGRDSGIFQALARRCNPGSHLLILDRHATLLRPAQRQPASRSCALVYFAGHAISAAVDHTQIELLSSLNTTDLVRNAEPYFIRADSSHSHEYTDPIGLKNAFTTGKQQTSVASIISRVSGLHLQMEDRRITHSHKLLSPPVPLPHANFEMCARRLVSITGDLSFRCGRSEFRGEHEDVDETFAIDTVTLWAEIIESCQKAIAAYLPKLLAAILTPADQTDDLVDTPRIAAAPCPGDYAMQPWPLAKPASAEDQECGVESM